LSSSLVHVRKKLEWWGYLTVKIEDMFSGVDSIPVCDKQTDR